MQGELLNLRTEKEMLKESVEDMVIRAMREAKVNLNKADQIQNSV